MHTAFGLKGTPGITEHCSAPQPWLCAHQIPLLISAMAPARASQEICSISPCLALPLESGIAFTGKETANDTYSFVKEPCTTSDVGVYKPGN